MDRLLTLLGLVRRNRAAILIAITILVLAFGGMLLAGLGQLNQTRQVVRASHQLLQAAVAARKEFDGPAKHIDDVMGKGGLAQLPVSPATGEPLHILQAGDEDTAGGFSYFLTLEGGSFNNCIIVCYYRPAQLPEVLASKAAAAFQPGKGSDAEWIRRNNSAKPCLVRISGKRGSDQEWLARGMSPREAQTRLQQLNDVECVIVDTEQGRK